MPRSPVIFNVERPLSRAANYRFGSDAAGQLARSEDRSQPEPVTAVSSWLAAADQ